ncbi:Protein of unknown function [Saccharopolyspora shandongensis]|uniref:DUF3558 domain-containing protein n=1 Tax=Saccharopolyspora shandongensis TaxID=418495 RepID=A0A1H2VC59_9PSEU|nr:DUF3558 family protein [Saccharopolyspora shandongensis]SDW65892.1 Protein of unknown function [Saccharopolyspora shandongensis]
MTAFSKPLIATAAGLSLLVLTACAGGGKTARSGEETSSALASASKFALASFDPCTFFESDELTSFGVSTKSEEFTQVSFQPGCEWRGEEFTLGLQKNADETVQSLGEGGGFDSYVPTTVGGREGAELLVAGATGQGLCNYVVSTGGGIAIYQLTGAMRDSVADPCGDLKKIVDQTASRLPK